MKICILIVTFLLSQATFADIDLPTLADAKACVIFGDMASVARAAAIVNISKPSTRAMIEEIYPWSKNEDGPILTSIVIDDSYQSSKPALEYARSFINSCIENKGQLEKFFDKIAI